MTQENESAESSFQQLGLSEPLLKAIGEVGYEIPTPIQAQTIPALLSGRDLIGQAQTGTGKTAAFALPLLTVVDPSLAQVQGLVLVPTRELALQVAEALHTYARFLPQVGVLPVYGGQPFSNQLKRLRHGVQVVVGTPGRVMDHIRRGSLVLDGIRMAILDEADEMLRMGFIEDVEWILSQTGEKRQTALFSATMPVAIRRIASGHLRDPLNVRIARKTLTVPTVDQRYLNVSEGQKLDALTRILGAEQSSAVLVFVRTKTGAAELAGKLEARGWSAEALHGDMTQAQREKLVRRLRQEEVEIVVATDVAARGLDVEHISHVINYDIPYDVEAYVHRIGRTGRAGRSGVAVLFVTSRERRMMREIERYIGHRLTSMRLPTRADMAARAAALLKESLRKTLREENLDLYVSLVEQLAEEENYDPVEVAAAAVRLTLGDRPIEVSVEPQPEEIPLVDEGMVRIFLAAGSRNGVRPADVVGAIANEGGVPGREIGPVDVYERFTFVELPVRYREQVLQQMARSRIRGRPVNIREATGERDAKPGRAAKKAASGKKTVKEPRRPKRVS